MKPSPLLAVARRSPRENEERLSQSENAMPLLRLLGLILFITSVFLALAAAASQTTQIRFSIPGGQRPGQEVGEAGGAEPAPGGASAPAAPAGQAEFHAVPIAWPLAICGGAGLLMWFGLAPRQNVKPARRRGGRRRK